MHLARKRLLLVLLSCVCLCVIFCLVSTRAGCESPSSPKGSGAEPATIIGPSKRVRLSSVSCVGSGCLVVAKTRGGWTKHVFIDDEGDQDTLCETPYLRGTFAVSGNGEFYAVTSGTWTRGEAVTTSVRRRRDGEQLYRLPSVGSPAAEVARVLDDGSAIVLHRVAASDVTPVTGGQVAFSVFDNQGKPMGRIPNTGILCTTHHGISLDGSTIAASCLTESSAGMAQVYDAVRVYSVTTGQELHKLPYSHRIAICSDGSVIALGVHVQTNPKTTVFRNGQLIGSVAPGYRPELSPAGAYLLQEEREGDLRIVAVYETATLRGTCKLPLDKDKFLGLLAIADNGVHAFAAARAAPRWRASLLPLRSRVNRFCDACLTPPRECRRGVRLSHLPCQPTGISYSLQRLEVNSCVSSWQERSVELPERTVLQCAFVEL